MSIITNKNSIQFEAELLPQAATLDTVKSWLNTTKSDRVLMTLGTQDGTSKRTARFIELDPQMAAVYRELLKRGVIGGGTMGNEQYVMSDVHRLRLKVTSLLTSIATFLLSLAAFVLSLIAVT